MLYERSKEEDRWKGEQENKRIRRALIRKAFFKVTRSGISIGAGIEHCQLYHIAKRISLSFPSFLLLISYDGF
jgi:hypothetical protein